MINIDLSCSQQLINNLMLQTPSQKIISSTKTRLKINISRPPEKSIQHNPSPMFARKRSISKSNHYPQQRKSRQHISIEKSLKYAVIMPPSPKSAISIVQSQVQAINLVTTKLQDSKKTVCRDRSIKKNEQQLLYVKRQDKDRSLSKRGVDTSRREKSKSPWMSTKDQNYIYWKNKAHQYLELNIKLMNEVRRLTKENQRTNSLLQQCQHQLAIRRQEESARSYNQATLTQEIRNISSIYINKIEGLQKELKRKVITINGYELKIKEMSNKLSGDNERIRLISKLQEQIERLKDEIFTYKNMDSLKLNSRLNQSTQLFGYEYDHH